MNQEYLSHEYTDERYQIRTRPQGRSTTQAGGPALPSHGNNHVPALKLLVHKSKRISPILALQKSH